MRCGRLRVSTAFRSVSTTSVWCATSVTVFGRYFSTHGTARCAISRVGALLQKSI